MRRLTAFLLAAALAAALASCSAVPSGDFTRDDTAEARYGDVAENSTQSTEQIGEDGSEKTTDASEESTEAPPLSAELLSGEKWSDDAKAGAASTILFNGGQTFVMTVSNGENSFINCMGLYKIVDGTVLCTVTECDLGGKLKSFALEYTGSSLVYRGETIGAVTDGTVFCK